MGFDLLFSFLEIPLIVQKQLQRFRSPICTHASVLLESNTAIETIRNVGKRQPRRFARTATNSRLRTSWRERPPDCEPLNFVETRIAMLTSISGEPLNLPTRPNRAPSQCPKYRSLRFRSPLLPTLPKWRHHRARTDVVGPRIGGCGGRCRIRRKGIQSRR